MSAGPRRNFPSPSALVYSASVLVFFAGLALHWLSIIYLGRFFTVGVAIATDHNVIDSNTFVIPHMRAR